MSKAGRASKKKDLRPCKACGYLFDKGLSRCASCGRWDFGGNTDDPSQDQTVLLGDAAVAPLVQLQTGPWDCCFGQQRQGKKVVLGIVNTGVTLLGGAPGAGKSTLSLQLAVSIIAATQREIIYLEAEESVEELKARAVRLQIPPAVLNMIRVIPMGSSADMASTLLNRKPSAIVIDSLQGLCNTDLEAQVEFCKALKDYTVPLKAPAIVVSHVTKEEGFAGLMALQHAVDTTVLFTVYDDGVREMKTIKNRFGPSNVEKLFNMTELGLVERSPEEDEDDD
jgi:DNA repair protein RadA/Sms